jgi:uncharacterized protein (DUF1330 family)
VNPKLTLVVLLSIRDDAKAEFEQFESAAAEIMKRHGGRIERRICLPAHDDPSEPDEVHIVTFPDQGAFDGYRQDPELSSLATLRAKAIRRTVVWRGADHEPFGAPVTPS